MNKKILPLLLINISAVVALSAETNALQKAIASGNGKYVAKIARETFLRENHGSKISLINENCPEVFDKCSQALMGGLANKNAEVRKTIASELNALLADSTSRSIIAAKFAPSIIKTCAMLTKLNDKDTAVLEALNSAKVACNPAFPELFFTGDVAGLSALTEDHYKKTKGISIDLALDIANRNLVKNFGVIVNTVAAPKTDAAVKKLLLAEIEAYIDSGARAPGPLSEPGKLRKGVYKALSGGSKKVKDAETKKRLAELAEGLK